MPCTLPAPLTSSSPDPVFSVCVDDGKHFAGRRRRGLEHDYLVTVESVNRRKKYIHITTYVCMYMCVCVCVCVCVCACVCA